ncbi:unnamed protein product [Rotaria sordida]|uniref:Uncharacterized protein n=1 Tax=Rotaria sordida TaxID=392033 RepID=A0A813Z7Y6_9BILA|nr:unnamed protein product [Rotaria sordida]
MKRFGMLLLMIFASLLPNATFAQYGFCTARNGRRGECISTSKCKTNGGSSDPANLCPGDNSIQCCTYRTCTNSKGVGGTCQPTATCSGSSDPANLCPGPNHVQCCTSNSGGSSSEAEKEKNKSRRNSIIHEFCLNTSTHGLPGIARSESLHNCLFWLISLLICTGFMLYLVIKAILAYFEYPTQLDVNIVPEWPQYFPAFSFCNVGAIRFDQFIEPFINYTNTLNLTNTNDTTTLSSFQAMYISSFVQYKLNRNESMDPFFYSLSSMLWTCSYNSQPCSASNFISFTTSTYGLCYTFNAKLKNDSVNTIRYGNENGGEGRLELGLYVHSNQYVPYLVDSTGIVCLIHGNRKIPLLEASGLNLIPGRKHKLSYRKKTSYFLSAPYTTCSDKVPLWMETVLNNYPIADYEYSQELCFRTAMQIFTYKQCGCVNHYMWDIRSIILPDTNNIIEAPLCNVTDNCTTQAADAYSVMPSDENDPNYCPQECSTTDFLFKKSSLLTPLEWQMSYIKTFVEESSIPLPSNWSTTWHEQIHKNYLAISLIRETAVIENNTQSAALSLVDVLSNIGGQTGLWIGISLLSFMELIEMIYRLLRYEYQIIRSRKERNQQIITQ